MNAPTPSIHDHDAPMVAISASITRSLAIIKRAWPYITNPPTTPSGRRGTMASRTPAPIDSISLIAEVTHDLSFWLHALLDDNPGALNHAGEETINMADVPTVASVLASNAAWCSGWEHGYRMAWELEDMSRWCAAAAWPRAGGTLLIGQCPNTIGHDGTPVTCGTNVRVNATSPGNIKCRGCGLTDTIDGWILRMVGSERLVTIPQLVPLLHQRMGIVVHERTLRRWHKGGRFTATGGTESTPLFDRRHVFAALAWQQERA